MERARLETPPYIEYMALTDWLLSRLNQCLCVSVEAVFVCKCGGGMIYAHIWHFLSPLPLLQSLCEST